VQINGTFGLGSEVGQVGQSPAIIEFRNCPGNRLIAYQSREGRYPETASASCKKLAPRLYTNGFVGEK
tara:strand:- start:172 stop:375 length:204 start_codon:yes stop_codon:yes gene_type:complete